MGIRLDNNQGSIPTPLPGSGGMPGQGDFAGVFQKVLKFARWGLTGVTLLYVLWLLAVIYMVEYQAEEHHITSILMYFPQYFWIFPLLGLGFCALVLWQWKLIIVDGVMMAVVLFYFMDYVWSGGREPSGPSVTLVTNNIGESHGKSIQPFIEREKPDLIALQDAGLRGPEYAKMFPEHYLSGQDQFLLISRHRIVNGGVLPLRDAEDVPVAAWFEVDVNGRGIYVFVLHMPTPRDQLNAIKGLGFFSSVIVRVKPGGHGDKVYHEGKAFFAKQLELAQGMVDIVKQADKPFIVCGDFNIPTHGKIYHLYKKNWTEAFAAAGKGYGYTFPGDMTGIRKIIGPWLRLDNIYCGGGLVPVRAAAETGRASQHRAMVATLELPK